MALCTDGAEHVGHGPGVRELEDDVGEGVTCNGTLPSDHEGVKRLCAEPGGVVKLLDHGSVTLRDLGLLKDRAVPANVLSNVMAKLLTPRLARRDASCWSVPPHPKMASR